MYAVVEGVVVIGHGVASGRSVGSPENPYPQGSIAMQAPLFMSMGVDLSRCYLGTINLDIAPFRWQLLKADHRFSHLRWTALHPPETFSFVAIDLNWQDAWSQGWLYYPHPETKAAHFQSGSVMEIIAPLLPGLNPTSRMRVRVRSDRLSVTRA